MPLPASRPGALTARFGRRFRGLRRGSPDPSPRGTWGEVPAEAGVLLRATGWGVTPPSAAPAARLLDSADGRRPRGLAPAGRRRARCAAAAPHARQDARANRGPAGPHCLRGLSRGQARGLDRGLACKQEGPVAMAHGAWRISGEHPWPQRRPCVRATRRCLQPGGRGAARWGASSKDVVRLRTPKRAHRPYPPWGASPTDCIPRRRTA